MGLFSKLKTPVFRKNDSDNNEKLIALVRWFIENDPFVTVIKNRSCNIIFSEGYNPIIFKETDPRNFKKEISTIIEWFMLQIRIDLNGLKNVSRERFKEFIDALGKISDQTLMKSGELAIKYNISAKQFNYDKEIIKIPDGEERDTFKHYFLLDAVVSAEMRILVWIYNEWFSEVYKPSDTIQDA